MDRSVPVPESGRGEALVKVPRGKRWGAARGPGPGRRGPATRLLR